MVERAGPPQSQAREDRHVTGRWVPTQEPCFNYWTEQLYCEYPPFLELPDGSFHGGVQPSLGRGSSGKLGSMLTPIYTGLWDLRGGSPFRRDTCPFTASLRRRLLQRRARMARVRDQSPWKGRQKTSLEVSLGGCCDVSPCFIFRPFLLPHVFPR